MYCRVLEVTVQGYKKYLKSLEKPYKYTVLLAQIKQIIAEDIYNKTYGKVRILEKLQFEFGCQYSYNTIAKVMRENNIKCIYKKPKSSTKYDKNAQKADDLLQRNFKAEKPLEKTVTDITEFTCADGKIYTSALFDCFDNSCLGISISDNMRTELVINTYKNAKMSNNLNKITTHSYRGSQYTSDIFKEFLKENNITQSMNSEAGRCHDNAKCESMWARAKSELFAIYNFKKLTKRQAKAIIYDYFIDYWNYRRICSAIGGIPPIIKRNAYLLKQLDLAA